MYFLMAYMLRNDPAGVQETDSKGGYIRIPIVSWIEASLCYADFNVSIELHRELQARNCYNSCEKEAINVAAICRGVGEYH